MTLKWKQTLTMVVMAMLAGEFPPTLCWAWSPVLWSLEGTFSDMSRKKCPICSGICFDICIGIRIRRLACVACRIHLLCPVILA